jgi:hypothetical protein
MRKYARFTHLNAYKRKETTESLMNDTSIKDNIVIAVTEPWSMLAGNDVLTVPAYHSRWNKIYPAARSEMWSPYRSILWIRKDLEYEIIGIPNPDITMVSIKLPQ